MAVQYRHYYQMQTLILYLRLQMPLILKIQICLLVFIVIQAVQQQQDMNSIGAVIVLLTKKEFTKFRGYGQVEI